MRSPPAGSENIFTKSSAFGFLLLASRVRSWSIFSASTLGFRELGEKLFGYLFLEGGHLGLIESGSSIFSPRLGGINITHAQQRAKVIGLSSRCAGRDVEEPTGRKSPTSRTGSLQIFSPLGWLKLQLSYCRSSIFVSCVIKRRGMFINIQNNVFQFRVRFSRTLSRAAGSVGIGALMASKPSFSSRELD